jgi:hypothetical protein
LYFVGSGLTGTVGREARRRQLVCDQAMFDFPNEAIKNPDQRFTHPICYLLLVSEFAQLSQNLIKRKKMGTHHETTISNNLINVPYLMELSCICRAN